MCDRMLQDSLRCYREPRRGVGIRARARGGDSGPGRGVGGDSGPGAGWGWGFEPGRGVEWGFEPGARGGDFFGKMENFLPFCRFFAV